MGPVPYYAVGLAEYDVALCISCCWTVQHCTQNVGHRMRHFKSRRSSFRRFNNTLVYLATSQAFYIKSSGDFESELVHMKVRWYCQVRLRSGTFNEHVECVPNNSYYVLPCTQTYRCSRLLHAVLYVAVLCCTACFSCRWLQAVGDRPRQLSEHHDELSHQTAQTMRTISQEVWIHLNLSILIHALRTRLRSRI